MKKSTSVKHLLSHTFTYSSLMFVSMYFISSDIVLSFKFFVVTLLLHTATDYFSSKLTKRAREKEKFYGINGFWSIIGFDQFLHIAQITITLNYLASTL